MKRVIRGFIRILALPFVVVFFLLLMATGYVFMFFEWVYEKDIQFTKDTQRDLRKDLKRTFKLF